MHPEFNAQHKLDSNADFNIDVDRTWHVRVAYATDVQTPSIEWKNYNIATERKILAQHLLLRWWAPFNLGQSHTIASNKFRMFETLLKLLTIIEKKYPKKACSELSRNDWVHIVLEYLFSAWNPDVKPIRALKKRSEILCAGIYIKTLTVLKKWHLSYIQGEANDGPNFELQLKDFDAAITSELIQRGATYDEWREGGSYGSIDFVVAHLLLVDAIEIVNSIKAKQLIAYFESTRIANSPSIVRAFWADKAETLLNRYRRTGDIKILVPTREAALHGVANECKSDFAPVLHERLNYLVPQTETFKFPWLTYRHLISDYNEVVGAIYVIFLTVMGKRGPSEIRSLRAIDITPPDDEHGHNAAFRPSISKTEKGLRQEQGVTNFIDDAFKVLLQLGYKEKKGTDLPLFSAVGTLTCIDKDPTKFSVHSAHRILKDYYENFCDRKKNSVEFDIKEKHEDISSHQFRHSFAEFALRRFDGYQIEEMLRMHFCHSHNHWWTRRYTSGKTDEDHETHLSRKYIRELIPKILSESHFDNDFVGGMAVYIKKQLSHSTKNLTPTEAEKYIKNFSEEFVQITPHEYGWCMLHKNFQNVAQCADEMGLPSPTTTSSEKCNSCANFCASRRSHLSAQKKIAIAHMDFVEQGIWKMPRLKQRSREAVLNAQQLFPELTALGNV